MSCSTARGADLNPNAQHVNAVTHCDEGGILESCYMHIPLGYEVVNKYYTLDSCNWQAQNIIITLVPITLKQESFQAIFAHKAPQMSDQYYLCDKDTFHLRVA